MQKIPNKKTRDAKDTKQKTTFMRKIQNKKNQWCERYQTNIFNNHSFIFKRLCTQLKQIWGMKEKVNTSNSGAMGSREHFSAS